MIPDDRAIRKSSKRPICRVIDSGRNWSKVTSFLPLTLHFWKLYLQWPYLWESGQVFQPTAPIKVPKQKRSQSTTKGVNKKVKESSLNLFALITNPENENGCGTQGYSFYNAHWAYKICSIGGIHQAYKAVTSLWVNIKLTRPTTSTLRTQQVYRVFRNL